MNLHIGEIAAVLTAVFWTATSLFFEAAARKIGSLNVNIIRLFIAAVLLSVFCLFYRGMILPLDASAHNLLFLSISGVIGFFIGDMFLFKAFVLIGSRISMLVMTTAPIFTTIISYYALGEILSVKQLSGVAITVAGIAVTVLTRNNAGGIRLSHPLKGLVYALIGALGQASGLVFSKIGMQGFDPVASGQIRILSGLLVFTLFALATRSIAALLPAIKDSRAMLLTSGGAFCGPFIGVSLSLVAITYTDNGVASALMSITPILIIPPAVILFRERLNRREIVGALLTVCGVVVLFWK
jgi:drug/metabolite transporter (DMT)-like permease